MTATNTNKAEAKTGLGTGDAATETPPPTGVYVRPKPTITPAMVKIQSVGYVNKSVICWAPEDMTLAQLNEDPGLWKPLQQDRTKALVEDDQVEIRFYDRRIYARVNHADDSKVYLFDIRLLDKPQRDIALWGDASFEIRHVMGGFSYFRKKDGVRMTSAAWPTPDAAQAACIRDQYAAKMG